MPVTLSFVWSGLCETLCQCLCITLCGCNSACVTVAFGGRLLGRLITLAGLRMLIYGIVFCQHKNPGVEFPAPSPKSSTEKQEAGYLELPIGAGAVLSAGCQKGGEAKELRTKVRGKVAERGAKGSIVVEESKGLAGGGGEPRPLMAFGSQIFKAWTVLKHEAEMWEGKSPPLPIKYRKQQFHGISF